MMQYKVDLDELAKILSRHFSVTDPVRVDISFGFTGGRVAKEGEKDLPSILIQISGVELTVLDGESGTPKTRGKSSSQAAVRAS